MYENQYQMGKSRWHSNAELLQLVVTGRGKVYKKEVKVMKDFEGTILRNIELGARLPPLGEFPEGTEAG